MANAESTLERVQTLSQGAGHTLPQIAAKGFLCLIKFAAFTNSCFLINWIYPCTLTFAGHYILQGACPSFNIFGILGMAWA